MPPVFAFQPSHVVCFVWMCFSLVWLLAAESTNKCGIGKTMGRQIVLARNINTMIRSLSLNFGAQSSVLHGVNHRIVLCRHCCRRRRRCWMLLLDRLSSVWHSFSAIHATLFLWFTNMWKFKHLLSLPFFFAAFLLPRRNGTHSLHLSTKKRKAHSHCLSISHLTKCNVCKVFKLHVPWPQKKAATAATHSRE